MKYLLYDNWGGSPHDAKKTISNTDDDLMCWAAAASNILAWTKWCFSPGQAFNNEVSVFKYFQDHWVDKVGYPNKAWEWWFNGEDFDDVDVSGGGFWPPPEYSFETYFHAQYDRKNALLAIDEFLHNGYGVVLELISQIGVHCITCWGYEQDEKGKYIGIYTTDSDDSSQIPHFYELNQDISGQDEFGGGKDWWYFTYHKNSTRFLLSTVYALDRCPDPQVPIPPSPPSNLKIV